MPEEERAAVVEVQSSAIGVPYEAVPGLPEESLFYTEWSSGGPGTSGFDRLTAVRLPSGRRAYFEWIFNGVDSESGSRAGQYLLAATQGTGDDDVDYEFLRLLFSTSGTAFHREWVPGLDVIETDRSFDEVVELFAVSGLEPDEFENEEVYEGMYAGEPDETDDDTEEEREEAEEETVDRWGIPSWASDLYVYTEIPEAERQARLAREWRRALGGQWKGLAVHAAMKRWEQRYAPYLPEENRAEYERRSAEQYRERLRAFLGPRLR
jgi:hypothetical protein